MIKPIKDLFYVSEGNESPTLKFLGDIIRNSTGGFVPLLLIMVGITFSGVQLFNQKFVEKKLIFGLCLSRLFLVPLLLSVFFFEKNFS